MRAGRRLAEVAVFLQEQLQEETWERRSSEHGQAFARVGLGGGGEEGDAMGNSAANLGPCRNAQLFFFLTRLHPEQPHLLRAPSCFGLCVCITGLGKTLTEPIIFYGSWVFGHNTVEA